MEVDGEEFLYINIHLNNLRKFIKTNNINMNLIENEPDLYPDEWDTGNPKEDNFE